MSVDNNFNLYSVCDRGAGLFGPVFEAVNDVVANRSYQAMLKKVDDSFKGEYVLYRVGSFDNKNGTIEAENTPQMVYTSDLVINQNVDKIVSKFQGKVVNRE
nr:MAG: nonstructural protein [Microvirus sp.]